MALLRDTHPEIYNMMKTPDSKLLTSNTKKLQTFICDEGHEFRSNTRLLLTGERRCPTCHPKPYICRECNSEFTKSDNLDRHRTKHLEILPFKCTESGCTETFARKDGLDLHMKTHHSTERVFECKQCPKTFVRKCEFERHMTTHIAEKSLKCEICLTKFRWLCNLTVHMRDYHGIIQVP